MTDTTITQALGAFASGARHAALPREVSEAVKLHLLDLFGAALAGHALGTASQMLEIAEGQGTATFWGTGRRGSRRDAALFNTFLSHACYMEDGSRYTGGHPASVVIPPAFVLAETSHVSGTDFIAALAVGYEVFLRLGRAMYPSIVRRGFQSTAVLGGVAAAAACASLLRLSPAAAGHAIALGAMGCAGFKEAVKSTASQPWQVARAAEGGLAAALLAQAGTEGASNIIEQGLFRGFADQVHAEGVLPDLGVRFSIGETYLKRHGGCRGNHAPVDVTESVVRDHGIALEAVGRISIHVDTVTFAEDIRHPGNGLQAQQSIAFAVAANLVFGDASPRRYTDDNLRDPAIRSLMERVRVAADPALDAGFPDRRPAVVVVSLEDGHSFDGYIDLAKGEPENPMTPEEVRRKFFSLATDQIGSAAADDLCSLVEGLEDVADVGDMARLLVARR